MINEHYNKHTFNDAIVYVFAFLCNGIINNIKECRHTKKAKRIYSTSRKHKFFVNFEA